MSKMSREMRDCFHFLIQSRRIARVALRDMEKINATRRQSRRLARKYRQSGNPLLIRNAEVIEARLKELDREIKLFSNLLVSVGQSVHMCADEIDDILTTQELCDLLEVNPVDRHRVGECAGVIEIIFIQGLEDSATYRDCDFKEGPLAQAVIAYMTHMMETNQAFKARLDDDLFGNGGMFEFLPVYRMDSSGDMVRQPPKLRLADKCDFESITHKEG